MTPGVFDDLGEAVVQAVHVRLAGPEELGQRPLVAQRVAADIVRTLAIVDPPDEFPPSDDLAHETLDVVQRCVPVLVGLHRSRDAVMGGKELQVQRSRQT